MSASRGFTLVEIIVVSALFLVLGGGLLTAFLSGQTSYLSADAYVQVQEEARKAFDNMVRELREAGNVSTTGTQQLNFQIALGYNLAAPCPANAVCLGAKDQTGVNQSGWTIRYRVNGTQLLREVLNGATVQETRVLANKIDTATPANTSFVWTPASKTVTMNLQIRCANAQLPNGAQTTGQLTSTVRLRN